MTGSMLRTLCSVFLMVLVLGVTHARAERRVALVIGNGAYEHAALLDNPRNDAADMSEKLKEFGFEVVLGLDLDLAGTQRVVREFFDKLDKADMGLFYYAGHGLQVSGKNYMAPVDARLDSAIDLEFHAVPIDLILSGMERSTDVNIAFLDACRDNPLARSLSRSLGTRSGSVGRGLAKLGTGVGSLIAFATQPGNVALDGDGRNSPFTAALLEHLGTPGQDITRDLIRVRRAVLEATDGKQVPWDNSSLTGEVILRPGEPDAAVAAPTHGQLEITFWNTIKDAGDKSYFQSYLNQYPDGVFASIARLKIVELEALDEGRRKQDENEAALREAEAAREAAVKARIEAETRLAELAEARRLEAEAREARQQDSLASLQQPVPEPEVPAVDPREDRELVRAIQVELNRIGCPVGGADGIWGRMTESGLKGFGRHAGVEPAALTPSRDLLARLKAEDGRICPLVCGQDEEIKGGRCVAKPRAASVSAPATPTATPRPASSGAARKKPDRNARVCYMCPEESQFGALVKKCKRLGDAWDNPASAALCKPI
ncbi:MAG: caspase family protein [Pseudomonadota bacterium]|nr:caspase family protein [Pseudomonadota bacterium]